MTDNLWAAFVADNGSSSILVASSKDGSSWTNSLPIYQTTPCSPSLAYFNGALYCAFISNDIDDTTGLPSNRILISVTTDGVSWGSAVFINQYSKCAPSLTVWNGSLHIAFVANSPTNLLLVYHSGRPLDATSWSPTVATNQTSANPPALLACGPAGRTGNLYLAFVAENGSNEVFICSLESGGVWSTAVQTKQSCHFSPSLAAVNGVLYLVFAAANGSRDLLVCARSQTGVWSEAVNMNQSTSAPPCAIGFSSSLFTGFLANNSSGEMLLVSNSNPTTKWSSSNVDLKQQSMTSPSIAVAPLACTPVSPAPQPGAGNSNYVVTNHDINDPLINLTVQFFTEQDLVCIESYNTNKQGLPTGKPVTTGFSFQLNCQPPGTVTTPYTGPYPPAGHAVWEQYGIEVQGRQFSMWYENSSSAGLGPTFTKNLFLLPEPNKIPRGYTIIMELNTDQTTHNITEFSVLVLDNTGFPVYGNSNFSPNNENWILNVASFPAPILNMQFDIGGFDDGQYSVFETGLQPFPLATVIYQADSPLMVRGASVGTAENSNITFGSLATYPSNPVYQACSGAVKLKVS